MDVGPACHSSSSSSLRPEPSGARTLAPSSPLPSISLLRSPNLDSSRENLPRHLLHLPEPPVRLLPGRNRPTTTGHHWRCLKLCSTVDPPLRSSSARTDRGNGFVVSSLCSPVFFPFRGVSPAPVNGRRRRRRTCCRRGAGQKLGIADGPPGRRGQSAGKIRFRPETMLSLVV